MIYERYRAHATTVHIEVTTVHPSLDPDHLMADERAKTDGKNHTVARRVRFIASPQFEFEAVAKALRKWRAS